jgi:hypothetical protein
LQNAAIWGCKQPAACRADWCAPAQNMQPPEPPVVLRGSTQMRRPPGKYGGEGGGGGSAPGGKAVLVEHNPALADVAERGDLCRQAARGLQAARAFPGADLAAAEAARCAAVGARLRQSTTCNTTYKLECGAGVELYVLGCDGPRGVRSACAPCGKAALGQRALAVVGCRGECARGRRMEESSQHATHFRRQVWQATAIHFG